MNSAGKRVYDTGAVDRASAIDEAFDCRSEKAKQPPNVRRGLLLRFVEEDIHRFFDEDDREPLTTNAICDRTRLGSIAS